MRFYNRQHTYYCGIDLHVKPETVRPGTTGRNEQDGEGRQRRETTDAMITTLRKALLFRDDLQIDYMGTDRIVYQCPVISRKTANGCGR